MRLILEDSNDKKTKEIDLDAILFATGRKPNVTNMGLETARVDFGENDGVYVNEYLQTTNKDVFSVGDCLALARSKQEAETLKGPGP